MSFVHLLVYVFHNIYSTLHCPTERGNLLGVAKKYIILEYFNILMHKVNFFPFYIIFCTVYAQNQHFNSILMLQFNSI